jgi:cytidylate kinase
MGMCTEEAEALDEHTEGVLARVLNSLQFLDPAFTAYAPPGAVLSDEAYRDAVERIVRAAAARGHVVIVGRGSQVLLAQRWDVLRVRIIAPLEQRIAYVMQRERLDQQAAASRIRMKDYDRTKYLETEYQRKPDEAHLYDIVLNMSFLDPASAVNVICLTLNYKARRLCAQTGSQDPPQAYHVTLVNCETSVQKIGARKVVVSGLARSLCSMLHLYRRRDLN